MKANLNLEQRAVKVCKKLKLPVKSSSVLSHKRNTLYCIKKIQGSSNGKDHVVSYTLQRALGVREVNHQLLPRKEAEEFKKRDKSFDYVTLDKLLERKRHIDEGKYKLYKGLIVGFNPNYNKGLTA